ncbi:hypothetical protein BDV93DRAFT_544076 [Ceratobasidium sp. AG-I]|nr:hypothetical protein BDV93DRAFT_544076 [Ceratobasidium sp. AG-I]
MSVLQVLNNAELLGLILALADTSTCARLISTSHNFFKQGIIHIWKDLSTAKPLILLIPGAQEVELKKGQYTIRLPPPPADFSRFDIYAPLVHSLATFGPSRPSYRSEFNIDYSWQALIFRARESPLLLNLKNFTLDHKFNKDEEPILWVSTFIAPSLTAFKATRLWCADSYATFSTMSIILRRIADHCPVLESLTLYLGSPDGAQDDASLFRMLLEEPPSRTWKNFKNLSSLVTDVNTLGADSLLSLGQLPHLNCLDIQSTDNSRLRYFTERLPNSVPNAALSRDSFPCLRRLTIRKLNYDDIMALWDLEPLVNKFTHLDLYSPPSRDQTNAAVRLLDGFLPTLAARSPQLTILKVCLKPSYVSTDPVPLAIEQWDCLASLLLQKLTILSAELYLASQLETPLFVKHIVTLWPNLTKLILPNQEISLGSLHHFTALPNLCELLLKLRWAEIWHIQDPIIHVPQDPPLRVLEFSTHITQNLVIYKVEELAKYLLSFWPKLGKVVHFHGSYSQLKIPSLDMLNFCIRTYQGLAETRERIAQQHGEEAAKCLISSQLNRL